ncbi:Serine/threonine-protein phosphatase [Spironucleus salmonicida]|uniref:Serine/threonine-protein phosphatase n=1 Tax=Spironucleus salmonicida TaxID=348837 RepID=V6LL87_9EUKA|nr:Serine/threonine-protein phosphatase [Spironucleus salmonicida]|eukprot:EST45400.1 Serine/threonine-protein phosphatase [Spironucleus salmonicida]
MEQFDYITDWVNQYDIRKLILGKTVIPYQQLLDLVELSTVYLKSLPNVERFDHDDYRVIGDLHGMYQSLQYVIPGKLDQNIRYVFIGDYVDRGFFGVEILFVLLSLLLEHKNNIILLRGNHETRQISQAGGFYLELIIKYSTQNYENIDDVILLYDAFVDLFHSLQLSCESKSAVFVHAGPCKIHISKLQQIDRFREIDIINANEDPLSDLLWSDYNKNQIESFIFNENRGIGSKFNNFLLFSDKKQLFRGHSMVDGFLEENNVITVFSVPNYDYNNKGAYYQNNQAVYFTVVDKIDNMPLYKSYSYKNYESCVLGLISGYFDIELKAMYTSIAGIEVDQSKRRITLDLLMLEYERSGRTPLNCLSLLDTPEKCLLVNGQSFEKLGYKVPHFFNQKISLDRLKDIIK